MDDGSQDEGSQIQQNRQIVVLIKEKAVNFFPGKYTKTENESLILGNKFRSLTEPIEMRFNNFENHLIEFYDKLNPFKNSVDVRLDKSLFINLLKSENTELEKQLAEKKFYH